MTKSIAIETCNAKTLNMDTLESIMRDIRISRRNVLAIEDNRGDLEKRRDEIRGEQQEALDKCDMDTLSKLTAELRRIIARLEEKPEAKVNALQHNLKRLTAFVDTNNDLVVVDAADTEVEEAQPEAA